MEYYMEQRRRLCRLAIKKKKKKLRFSSSFLLSSFYSSILIRRVFCICWFGFGYCMNERKKAAVDVSFIWRICVGLLFLPGQCSLIFLFHNCNTTLALTQLQFFVDLY